MNLGTGSDCIKGFIQRNSRCYTIILNENLPEYNKRIVKLHEVMHYYLGHLNNRICTFQDRYFSYMQTNDPVMKFENEANFVLSDYLLDTGDTLEALGSLTIEAAASSLYVPEEILKFKCRMIGYMGLLSNANNVSLGIKSGFLGKIKCDGECDWCQ